MSLTGKLRLIGAMRLVKNVDGIGVALFDTPGSNAMFVPEMNSDLSISGFLNFSNEEGYIIDYELPLVAKHRTMSVLEPAPIPFWINGKCFLIAGDAESEDVRKEFGPIAHKDPVLIDIRQLLADARSGVFHRRQEAWVARDIATSFSDLFYEPPVHSKYWISRFNDSVRHAKSLTKSPHPIDLELRRIGLEWIKRFATKTDLKRLMGIIGNLLEGALTKERGKAILFAFFVHKLKARRFHEIEEDLLNDIYFKKLFPSGIFQYWREQDFPRVSFQYDRPRDLFDPLYDELRNAESTENFKRAERMAYLYFGFANSPREIDDFISPIFNRCSDEFSRTRYRGLRPNKELTSWYLDEAQYMVNLYNTMMRLDGIMNGDARLSQTIVDRRFGIDSYFIKSMINIVNGTERDEN